MFLISYYDITLLCGRIHLKWISLCYCTKSWRQNYFESTSLWRWLLPYISWSSSSIRISHTFVLFKLVILTGINYLETWLRSDNTSCYYTNFNLAINSTSMASTSFKIDNVKANEYERHDSVNSSSLLQQSKSEWLRMRFTGVVSMPGKSLLHF